MLRSVKEAGRDQQGSLTEKSGEADSTYLRGFFAGMREGKGRSKDFSKATSKVEEKCDWETATRLLAAIGSSSAMRKSLLSLRICAEEEEETQKKQQQHRRRAEDEEDNREDRFEIGRAHV